MRRPILLAALVCAPMIGEARRSRRNERALRAAGALEPHGDVYAAMQVVYPACFLGMIAEGSMRPAPAGREAAGAALFVAAKALKYWAIATLGPRWTFRVLVPPGAPPVTAGPYRWLRHPNYAGVAGEIAGTALMARARWTGVAALVLFGGLMLTRIAVEDRALEAGARER